MRIVPRGMTGAKNGRNAWHKNFLILVLCYFVAKGSKDTFRILYLPLRRLRKFADVALVHPERPFGLRHHNFRVRKHWLVVGPNQPVDMIAVEMRNDDD